MTRWRSKSIAAAAVMVLAATLIFVIYVFVTNRRLETAFETIERGMTKSQVIARMGAPDDIAPGCWGHPFWKGEWLYGKSCADHFLYWAYFKPVVWEIGFDAKGRVFAKFFMVSP